MQGDDIGSAWEVQTRELLESTNHDIRETENRLALLVQRKRALDEALRAYRGAIVDLPPFSPEVEITREAEALDLDEIKGMSQKNILKLIASRSGNVLHVARAKRLMKAANVFGNPGHSDSAVYSIVLRSPEFVKIDKGIYRVEEISRKAPRPPRSRTNSGIRDMVKTIKNAYPSWTKKQVLEKLLEIGFDFGDKRPMSVVNMAWVAEGYAGKEKQGGIDGLWSEAAQLDTTGNTPRS